jgi:hypothetical protein
MAMGRKNYRTLVERVTEAAEASLASQGLVEQQALPDAQREIEEPG